MAGVVENAYYVGVRASYEGRGHLVAVVDAKRNITTHAMISACQRYRQAARISSTTYCNSSCKSSDWVCINLFPGAANGDL